MAKLNNDTDFEIVHDGFPNDLVRFKGTALRGDPREFSQNVENFEIRDDDVWLCGYMRSGTCWTKEMIWRIANDFSFENKEPLTKRFPCFDGLVIKNRLISINRTYDDLLVEMNSLPSPRFLKSHLPFHLLPRQLRLGEKKPKIICVVRNPKDVCVSLHYFNRHFHNYQGSLEETTDLFLTDKSNYAPYWDNVLSYWQKGKDFNILFIKFEDMKKDLPSVIRKTADFLGKTPTDEQVAALTSHLTFENFRKDSKLTDADIDEIYTKRFNHKDSKGFVRKGTIDQWKEEMTADTVRRFDEWINKNLQNTDYVI